MHNTLKKRIASELQDLLDFKSSPHIEETKGYKLVGIIVRVIQKALLEGKTIYIEGFGTFSTRTKVPRRFPERYFYGRKNGSMQMVQHPAKKYIAFHSDRSLRDFINKPLLEAEDGQS